jgi:transcriptional regulator GlxA family with amidase domain
MKIVIVGLDGCHTGNFYGLTEIFNLAQRAIKTVTGAPASFEVITASVDGSSFQDGRGQHCDVDVALEAITTCDAILIPGLAPNRDGNVRAMSKFPRAIGWMRRLQARGALVGAICSSVFLLGEAGLLDGRRCTTTWWSCDELKRRYPRAETVLGAALIADRGVVTTGAWLSWVDLAFHMIRRDRLKVGGAIGSGSLFAGETL